MEGIIEFMAIIISKIDHILTEIGMIFEIFLVVPKFIFSILTSDLEDLIDRQSSSSSEEP